MFYQSMLLLIDLGTFINCRELAEDCFPGLHCTVSLPACNRGLFLSCSNSCCWVSIYVSQASKACLKTLQVGLLNFILTWNIFVLPLPTAKNKPWAFPLLSNLTPPLLVQTQGKIHWSQGVRCSWNGQGVFDCWGMLMGAGWSSPGLWSYEPAW